MVLLKNIFYNESDPRMDYCRLFFIHFVVHALALHLAVKILLQIFCMKTSTLALHTSVGCISSRMPAGPHFVKRNQYY